MLFFQLCIQAGLVVYRVVDFYLGRKRTIQYSTYEEF